MWMSPKQIYEQSDGKMLSKIVPYVLTLHQKSSILFFKTQRTLHMHVYAWVGVRRKRKYTCRVNSAFCRDETAEWVHETHQSLRPVHIAATEPNWTKLAVRVQFWTCSELTQFSWVNGRLCIVSLPRRCCSAVVAPSNCARPTLVGCARRPPPASPPAVSRTTVTRTPPRPTTRRSSRRCCWPAPWSPSGCPTWYSSCCRHTSAQNSKSTWPISCGSLVVVHELTHRSSVFPK